MRLCRRCAGAREASLLVNVKRRRAPCEHGRSALDVYKIIGGVMIINKLMKTFARVLLVPAIVSCCSPSLPCQSAATPASVTTDSVLGSWKGESICVGDRPACKNEVVVYRFRFLHSIWRVPLPNHSVLG